MECLVPRPQAHHMDRQTSTTAHLHEADPTILAQKTTNPYNNPNTGVECNVPSIQNIAADEAAMDTQVVILMDPNRQEPSPLENFNNERMPPLRRGGNPPLPRHEMPTRTSETNMGGSTQQTKPMAKHQPHTTRTTRRPVGGLESMARRPTDTTCDIRLAGRHPNSTRPTDVRMESFLRRIYHGLLGSNSTIIPRIPQQKDDGKKIDEQTNQEDVGK
jgi:hypothetical protein